MDKEKTGKSLFAGKATFELALVILVAMVSFLTLNYLEFFDKLYNLPGQHHKNVHELLLFAAFFALAIAVFAFRRWFELRKAHKKQVSSDKELRFQAILLDKIGDGITATDFKGIITYVNQAQCDRVKRSRKELIGQSVKIYGQDPSLGTTQEEIVQTTLKNGRWSGEICNTTSDGSKIIVECHTWLMKDENGNPTGLCGLARDITERKLHQQELQKHKQYLEALDIASGILLDSISEIKYDEFLAALGPASNADRVHIFLSLTDKKLNIPLRRKTQWCRDEKIPPVPTKLTENRFLKEIFPEWQKILATGKHLCFCTENFPSEQFEFWESLQIKALLIVPVIIDDKLNGFMSFDNCEEARHWTESEIEFLRTAAVDLAFAIKRLEIKKELIAQGDFAQKLIETVPTIVLVLDKDANITTFNSYFERISGYKLDEVKGKNWFEIFLPEQDRPVIGKIFEKAISDIPTKGNINPIIVKNGSIRYVEWFDKTLKDENGQITGLLSTGQDITERLEAEDKLKDSEARLKIMFDDSRDGLVLADVETKKFPIHNKMICEMLGYTEEEMSHVSMKNIHPEKDLPKVIETFERQRRGEIRLAENIPVKRKDGSVFYADINSSPITLSGKLYLLGSFRDITERKRAEELLRDSEERYRLIFDGITDAVFIHGIGDDNMPGKFLAVNNVACKRLGYSREELLRMSPGNIDASESTADVRAVTEKLKQGENVLFEQIHAAKDGRRIPVEINAQHFLMHGRPLILSVVRDITDRKQAEEEIKRAHSELEQRVIQRTAALQVINAQLTKTVEERNYIQKILRETEKIAAVGKLSAQIAHEINNPLAGIKNSFLLIKDAIPQNHQYFEYVGRIEKEINRVSRIVKQMFDLYRPDTRSIDKFKVCEVIGDITELLKIAGQEKQVHITIDCPDNIIVELSEALFRQIIYNVVQNAIQVSPPQGTVKITVLTDDSKLNIQISDEGPGIDAKIRNKIFEPFFTTGTGSGLGLGLSITKDIISAMEGKIDFENHPPTGTTFKISIPSTNEPKK